VDRHSPGLACNARRARWVALVAALAFGCFSLVARPSLAAGAQARAASAPSTAAAEIGEECADCHAGIVASYARGGMARALGPIEPGELARLPELVDRTGGWVYELGEGVHERAGMRFGREGAWIASARLLPDGTRAAPDFSPLAFAIGAGLLDRSYAALRGELLSFAPLEVLSARGTHARRAVLAPGQSIRPGTHFDAPITPECLACHTDRPPPPDYPLAARPPAASWQPRGIDCGACHAGALAHARWRRDSQPEGQDPLRSHASWSAHQRLSSCAGCHLQGDARIELDARRLGPPEPGSDLLEQRAVFVARDAGPEIGFVSQVERLVLSRCFTQAAAGREPVCETCHDPHVSLAEPGERERVRGACLDCHAGGTHARMRPAHVAACALSEEQRGARDCASCHMPLRQPFDLAEVEIHDHWIQRAPPQVAAPAKLRFDEAAGGALRLFEWPGHAPRAHAQDAGLWMMARSKLGDREGALRHALETPGPRSAALAMQQHVRGTVFEANARPQQARVAYERALELDPGLGESATNLGLLLARLGEARAGHELLSALIERHPRAEGALRNRALVRQQLGDERGMLADLERAYALAPRASVAAALAQLAQGRGDRAQQARWAAEAARLDPLSLPKAAR
jgi:predicted CXXCH cytochrome family protein